MKLNLYSEKNSFVIKFLWPKYHIEKKFFDRLKLRLRERETDREREREKERERERKREGQIDRERKATKNFLYMFIPQF